MIPLYLATRACAAAKSAFWRMLFRHKLLIPLYLAIWQRKTRFLTSGKVLPN
jgi:hypothetical protein